MFCVCKIILNSLFLLKTIDCSYFEDCKISSDNRKSEYTEDIPCIKEMNKLLATLNKEIKPLKAREECLSLLYDESYDDKKVFFNNLLNSDFYNGQDFPIPYNSELEKFQDAFSIPTFPSYVYEKCSLIFGKIRFSKTGRQMYLYFITIENDYYSLQEFDYQNFLKLVQFLHDKLLNSKIRNIKFWDHTSFEELKRLKKLYEEYTGILNEFYEKYNKFLEEFKRFYREWLELPSYKKYYVIYGHEHPESGVEEKEFIISLCKNKTKEIETLNRKVLKDCIEKFENIDEIEIGLNLLPALMNLVYDCEILTQKILKFLNFFYNYESFPHQQHYLEKESIFTNKSDKYIKYLNESLKEISGNKDIKNKLDLIWKRIILEIRSDPRILETFFKDKYEESIKLGKKGNSIMIDLLTKEYKITEESATKFIEDFEKNIFDLEIFSELKLKFYSDYSYFLSFNSFSQFQAIYSMKTQLVKQLEILSCGSNNKTDPNLYSLLNDLAVNLNEILDSRKVNSVLFNYIGDKSEEEIDIKNYE